MFASSYTDKVVAMLSEQRAMFLRSPQAKRPIDLSNAFVWNADFSGADFGNTNLTTFYADQIDVTGADLRAAELRLLLEARCVVARSAR